MNSINQLINQIPVFLILKSKQIVLIGYGCSIPVHHFKKLRLKRKNQRIYYKQTKRVMTFWNTTPIMAESKKQNSRLSHSDVKQEQEESDTNSFYEESIIHQFLFGLQLEMKYQHLTQYPNEKFQTPIQVRCKCEQKFTSFVIK